MAILPAASLGRTKRAGAIIYVILAASIILASREFAIRAVGISPPELSKGFITALFLGVAAAAVLSFRFGADAIAGALEAPIKKLVAFVGRISLYLVLTMATFQFAIVIMRYVFGVNFIAMQESVTYMHGSVFLLAGGYALLADDHVRVDIFYRDARPRRKAAIDFAGSYVFLFPFCFVALWAAGPYVANSWAVREGSMEQSGIQGVYLLKSLIIAYLILLALAGFVLATRAAHNLKTSDA